MMSMDAILLLHKGKVETVMKMWENIFMLYDTELYLK